MLRLDNRINIVIFVVLVLMIIFIGSMKTIDLPKFMDKILDNYIVKIILLILLLVIGKYQLPIAIIIAVFYISLEERIINKEIEKYKMY